MLTSTGNTNTSSSNTTSDNPPLAKSPSHSSHGMGTGGIAGIAAAIVVLAVAVVGFCLWRFKFRKSKRANSITNKAELEGDREPKGVHERFGKQRLSEESTHDAKKGVRAEVNEVVQTPPPVELDSAGHWRRRSTAEMGNGQTFRAELPSPDPSRPELESHGLGLIRSELSTPEPPSELSTADRSLVPELLSRDMAHELPGSNRNSRVRPTSYREDSMNSDIFPSESASNRPGLNGRKSSQDTIASPPISPHSRRESLRGFQRRHSGLHNTRLQSSSSHDTFQTRFNEISSAPQPQQRGSPSPLASPPLGSQPSPSLSALNSPTIPHPHRADSGPPTPAPFDLTEREPLMSSHQQQASRATRFSENLTADPETITAEERQRREEARVVVKEEVDRIEDRARREGM